MPKKTPKNFRLSAEVLARLEVLAKQGKCSVTDALETAVMAYPTVSLVCVDPTGIVNVRPDEPERTITPRTAKKLRDFVEKSVPPVTRKDWEQVKAIALSARQSGKTATNTEMLKRLVERAPLPKGNGKLL